MLIKSSVPIAMTNLQPLSYNFFTSASQSGNVGIVHHVRTKLDMDWLLEIGPDAPYVVLLPPDLFRRLEKHFVWY